MTGVARRTVGDWLGVNDAPPNFVAIAMGNSEIGAVTGVFVKARQFTKSRR